MFTLGDVADILDSALDTGISIVDALAKLSDLADEGSLANAKFVDLAVGSGTASGKVYDENGNIVGRNSVDIIGNDSEVNTSNAILSDDSGMCSGNSINSCDRSSKNITDSENALSSIDCYEGLNLREKRPSGDFPCKTTVTRNIGVSHNDKLSETFQRCGTYVLQPVKDKTRKEDKSMSEFPVFQAFGNLCHVADDVLKYNQGDGVQMDHDKCDSTESKSDTLDLKVNDMLQSFQKLDETVEKLKQQALHRHLISHPEDLHLFANHRHSIDRVDVVKENITNSGSYVLETRNVPATNMQGSLNAQSCLEDDSFPNGRSVSIDSSDNKIQNSGLIFDMHAVHPYSRQTSQETYVLDDGIEYDDDISVLSSDEKTEMKNDNLILKSSDPLILLQSSGNLKSCNSVSLSGGNGGISSGSSLDVFDMNENCVGQDNKNDTSLLFYQEQSNSSTPKLRRSKRQNTPNGISEKRNSSPTFERNSNCRNTYVLHSSSQETNSQTANVSKAPSDNDCSVKQGSSSLHMRSANKKENSNLLRQTYIVCQNGDTHTKVKDTNEVEFGGINLGGNSKLDMNYVVHEGKSTDKSKKKDDSLDANCSSVPLSRSDVRSTYILSRTDKTVVKCDDKKREINDEDINNNVEDGTEKNDSNQNNDVSSDCSGKRSTYVIDVSKSKNVKKKSISNKPLNFEFFRNAQANNDVMFYVGKKERKDNELGESPNYSSTVAPQLQNKKTDSSEVLDKSQVGPLDVLSPCLHPNETFDCSSIDDRSLCEQADQNPNIDNSSDCLKEFELLYEINNSGDIKVDHQIELNSSATSISECSDIDTKQEEESFEEFELIYEIAGPLQVKNNENIAKDKVGMKSSSNTAYMTLNDDSCCKNTSDTALLLSLTLSRENTFIKEDNKDNEKAVSSDIVPHASRENTFIKDELLVDSIETEYTCTNNVSSELLTDMSSELLTEPSIDKLNVPIPQAIVNSSSDEVCCGLLSSGDTGESSFCEVSKNSSLNEIQHDLSNGSANNLLLCERVMDGLDELSCESSLDTSGEVFDTSDVSMSNSYMVNVSPATRKKYNRAASLDTLMENSLPSSRNYERSHSNPSRLNVPCVTPHFHEPQKALCEKLDTLQNLMSSSLTKLNTLNYFHEKSNLFALKSHEDITEGLTSEECYTIQHKKQLSLQEMSLGLDSVPKENRSSSVHEYTSQKSSTPTNSGVPSFGIVEEAFTHISPTRLNADLCSDSSSSETNVVWSQSLTAQDIHPLGTKLDKDLKNSHNLGLDHGEYEKTKLLPLTGLFFSSENYSYGDVPPTKSSVCRSDTFVVSPRDEKKSKVNNTPSMGVSRNETFLIDKNSKPKLNSELKGKQQVTDVSNDRDCYSAMNEYHCNDPVKVSKRPLSAGSSQTSKSAKIEVMRRKSACDDVTEIASTQTCLHPISFFYTLDTNAVTNTMTTGKDINVNQMIPNGTEYFNLNSFKPKPKVAESCDSFEKVDYVHSNCIGDNPEKGNSTSNTIRKKPRRSSKQKLLDKENEDETLSIQLAALRMQLEEKRRRFDEEKKRKQEQWREERAKNLQNAFFVMLNNNEQDPAELLLGNMELDSNQLTSNTSKHIGQDSCEPKVDIDGNEWKTNHTQQTEEKTETETMKGVENFRESEDIHANEAVGISYTISDGTVPSISLHTTDITNGVEIDRIPFEVDDDQPLSKLIKEFSPFSNDDVQSNIVSCSTLPSNVTGEYGKSDTLHYSDGTFHDPCTPGISSLLNELGSTPQELMSAQSDSNFDFGIKQNTLIENFDQMKSFGSDNILTLPKNEPPDIGHSVIRKDLELKSYLEQEIVPNTTIDSVLAQVGSSPYTSLNHADITVPEEEPMIIANKDSHFPDVLQTGEEPDFVQGLPIDMQKVEDIVPKDERPINVENVLSEVLRCEQSPADLLPTPDIHENVTVPNQDVIPEKVSDVLSQENVAKTPSATTFVVGIDMMGTPELTPQQIKKRERFLRQRQKNIEEEKEKKAAELEKKMRMEESTPKKTAKEEHPKDGNLGQDVLNKRLGNDQISHESPSRKPKREPAAPRMPRTPQHSAATPTSSNSNQSDEASRYTEYTGPDAYKKPSGKSNRKIIQNAIMHCCLCGEVNKESKKKCLDALEKSDANHFLVLFREGLKFRSVYEYHPENELVVRVYGIGPKNLTEKMVTKYYKYNSGGKEFYSLETKHLSIQVDGLMIKKELWEKKQSNSSKTDSNLKKFLSGQQK